MAYKALKLARSIKSSQERKFFDTLVSDSSVNWNGTASIFLNNLSQGLTDSQRIGDTIKCISFRFRFEANRDNSSSAAVRAIYIWDKRNTIAAISDLLVNLGNEEALLSDYLHDKRGDYIVLYDKMIRCDGQYINKNVGMVHKKLNKKTQFAGGTTTIEQGALKLFMISDVSNGAVNQPNYDAYIRLFYSDS